MAPERCPSQGLRPPSFDKQRLSELIYVVANPPFNDSAWFRKDVDVRWQFGVPRNGNTNFAWAQHLIHHLALDTNICGRQRLN